MAIFKDFDLTNFWKDSEYASEDYIEEYPTDELIASIEQELGYKLPASYIELMRNQNGGIPNNTCFPMKAKTSWADNHIAITGILAIGRNKRYSIDGSSGSKFMIDEWGYPDIGVMICDCPSGGHDILMLDYSKCGPKGEPEVVHIDQEWDYKKTFVAKDFETFVRGLVSDDVYDTTAEDRIKTLETFKSGRFSDTLQKFFPIDQSVDFDHVLRNLFTTITNKKGYFALHDDDLSRLAYSIQFYLLSINHSIKSRDEFLKQYPGMLAMGNNEISTNGYAPGFIEGWFDERVAKNDIAKTASGDYQFSQEYLKLMFTNLQEFQ